jgi:hypothetical protein
MSLKKHLCMALNLLGFESINDLMVSVFALKTKVMTFYTYGFAIGGIVAFMRVISENTAVYVYSPPAGIAILGGVSLMDFALGVSNSIVSKRSDFNSWRIPRSVVRFIVQVAFVAIVFNMNLIWSIFIQSWMVDSLLLIFILSTLWSAMENARDVKIITQEQFELIESFVNIKKLIAKIKTRGNDDQNGAN